MAQEKQVRGPAPRPAIGWWNERGFSGHWRFTRWAFRSSEKLQIPIPKPAFALGRAPPWRVPGKISNRTKHEGALSISASLQILVFDARVVSQAAILHFPLVPGVWALIITWRLGFGTRHGGARPRAEAGLGFAAIAAGPVPNHACHPRRSR